MRVGETVMRRGFFGKALFLRSQPTDELEERLGYRRGRLRDGWWLLFLLEKPSPNEFQFRGYSQMSGGVAMGHLKNPTDPRNAEQRLLDDGYNVPAMKDRLISEVFALDGPDRLAKVEPVRDEFGENDYPAGSGVPQWTLSKPKQFKVAAFIKAGQTYLGNYV